MIGVTGGTGFVGRRLVARLATSSRVRVLAHKSEQAAVPNVKYILGDLTNQEAVTEFVNGCSSLIHLAGVAHTSLRTDGEKERSYAVNVNGTESLLNAALRTGVKRLLFVSTAHVYADHKGVGLDEDSPVGPSSYYAGTKIKAEQLVRQAGDRGLQIVIVRPCLIYGPGARFNLYTLMRGIDTRYYFHLSGESPLRSFLSVENASRAISFLVRSETASGVYNLADETPYSLVDFANELADRMKRPRPVTMPSSLIHALGCAGAGVQKFGVNVPLTRETLDKLTSNFTLSTRRLADVGFEWDDDCGIVRQEMVNHYLASKQTPHS